MKNRMMQDGFGFSALTLGVLVVAVAVVMIGAELIPPLEAQAGQGGQAAQGTQGAAGGQRGQAAPPAPCGPNLAGDIAKNTAPNSRCFELRMYTVDPTRDGQPARGGGQYKGGINELHQRFREKEVELFKKNGAEVIAVWQNLGEPNTLIYMLAFKDRAHRDAVWAAFNADPEWTALRNKYFVPLQPASVTFMSATDYSPMK